ncbi:hypothetical protein F8388_014807 [Cannabis sativa]|uniref:RNase H type-1 domain-containing protein n=1 Tax=Cannabis sativa TaxID=3483 RepID=A0A7J6GYS0_CANSA|nr:hypothetical protein F8388_014807 [Cannabis sativa]
MQWAEASEWRELRRQLPGKRRQVEVIVEDRPVTGEVVMNRFPAVELLGIGEITPFENTAEGVFEKVIPKRPLHEIVTVPGAPTNPGPTISSTKSGQPGSATKACSHAEEPDKTNATLNALENGGKGNLPTKGMKSPGKPSDSDIASSSNGSKAQPLDWPSRACWASAFGPLTGSKTVDKYHREPIIFNPILCIDDFNCYESEHGPRKRKAMDGFYMIHGVIPSPETIPTHEDNQNTLANTELQPDTEETTASVFSPDSSDDKPAKRKRGRPRKCEDPDSTPVATDKKRERPPRAKAWTGVTSKSLKKRGANSSSRGKTSHYRNLWNAKCFDLDIDLDNHFVVKEADKNALLGSIESDPPGTKWNLIGIYGPPTMSGREDFWNRIGDLIVKESSPTVLIGDLNGTLADHECLNYANQKNSARYSFDLRRMVVRTGLVDLGCLGGKFTWFQKASQSTGGASVRRARLDRALASIDWRILFPNVVVELLTVGTSDHKPILLNTEGGTRCLKSQFKYELMWGRDPRCFWVVRNAWRDNLHHDPMVNLYRKLRKIKEHLKKWNKMHFGKIQQQVADAKKTLDKIENWFNPADAAAILNIDLPDERVEDSWIWIGEQNGNFSIRSACRFINGDHSANTECDLWKLIWNSPLHMRLKFLWWQLFRGILPTKDKLAPFSDGVLGPCPMCKEECETSFHLFWNCNIPKAIWFSLGWGIRTELVTATSIWRERNQRVHDKKDTELVLIIDSVRQKIHDHVMVASNRVEEVLEWTPPPSSWACCNSDVAISATGCLLSAVIRDDSGTILSITVKTGMVTSPKLAEAHAVCLAAEKAIELGLKNIIFQCDNRCVVKAFEAPMSICVDFSLQEAKSRFLHCCDKLNDWGIVHISRKCNYMAHNIVHIKQSRWGRLLESKMIVEGLEPRTTTD